MNRLPDQVEPLPRVASPFAWSWWHFRVHHLSSVASGLAVMAAIWLWTVNLPESVESDESGSTALSVTGPENFPPPSDAVSGTNIVVADLPAAPMGDSRAATEKFGDHD